MCREKSEKQETSHKRKGSPLRVQGKGLLDSDCYLLYRGSPLRVQGKEVCCAVRLSSRKIIIYACSVLIGIFFSLADCLILMAIVVYYS